VGVVRVLGVLGLGGLLVAACGHGRNAPGDLKPVFEDPHFTVGVVAPAQVRSGQAAEAMVRVEPIAPYHVNLEFPTNLQVEAPDGVEMATVAFDKSNARQIDEQALVFAVPFTPTRKGRKTFACQIEFAVCTDEECVPAKLPVEFAVAVGR
jgi:hypothetical protein